jgi:hypothetical protein
MAALQEASGIVVLKDDVLSLQDTDALRAAFFAKVARKDSFRQLWPTTALPEIVTILQNVARQTAGTQVVLLSSVDRDMGAVYVPAEQVLEHAPAVWGIVGEDLCILTPDINEGLCLGREYYNAVGVYVSDGIYELRAWGRFVPA